MANSVLPQDLLLEIFSRIPTKSVGKCRTLSKYWNAQLSTTSFIKKHLFTRKLTIQNENLALVTTEKEFYMSTCPTKKNEAWQTKGFPDKCFCVLGSCNGLILLNGLKDLILMNPVTRKQVTIQPLVTPELPRFTYCISVGSGFGYDSCSDDYKVVKFFTYSSRDGNGDRVVTTYVHVYSVNNGVWKRVANDYRFHGLVRSFEGGGAFVNGALHWLVCKPGIPNPSCIAVFDLAKEVFREIPLPEEFVRQPGNHVLGFNMSRYGGLSVVDGCLSTVDNYGKGTTDVWIMREYGVAESWVKFRIEAGDAKWESIVATLCYVEDGELLFLTSWDNLFACDLKGGTVRKVVLDEHHVWFYGMAFVDSLVSPERSA